MKVTLIRLLLLIFAQLLFAAHMMHLYGLIWAFLVLASLTTLFVQRDWIIRIWQVVITFETIEWIRTTVILVQFRLAVELPYSRLLVIMITIILFNLFVVYWLQKPGFIEFFRKKKV